MNNANRGRASGRKWVFVPYDQLSDKIGPLSRENPGNLGIVLIDSSWKWARRPYHKQKIALVTANMRWFAIEQARRGIRVMYVDTDLPYRFALENVIKKLGKLYVMEPTERELRSEIEQLVRNRFLDVVPHEGWLTSRELFQFSMHGKSRRMDAFYRAVRRETGILMEKGKPIAGKLSFDSENRLPWKGHPPSPIPPMFSNDPIKDEVISLVKDVYARHPGEILPESLPVTSQDANELWSWAKNECLENFGPFEDAMSALSSGLFHTRISSLLNIHRLTPKHVLRDVLQMNIPLPSKEGFIRQIIGWREYVYHIHRETDGFRKYAEIETKTLDTPGDGGYETWSGKRWSVSLFDDDPDGGAIPNQLGCYNSLPPAFWGVETGMYCLDHVVKSVWKEAWSHHITRLMILSNIASLLDVNPRELTDWFWVAYADAYDWVVEPNVLGMGTYAIGDFMTTKPYIAGSSYINRMSDFCKRCRFNPSISCPITKLYWAYLARRQSILQKNPRMFAAYSALAKRSSLDKAKDVQVYENVKERLLSGDIVE